MVVAVPIKVSIGLRPNGHADHPDWTRLPLETIGGDRHETHQYIKWRYDNTSGPESKLPDSPIGIQLGMLVVSPTFADEAVAMFPNLVSKMTDAEARIFWETRANQKILAEKINTNRLQGLKVRRDLMVSLGNSTATIDLEIAKALDPNDPAPGVIKTKDKLWDDAKSHFDLTVR